MICLYTCISNPDSREDRASCFYLLACFDKQGLVDRQELESVHDKYFFTKRVNSPGHFGPFEEISRLIKFISKVCEETDRPNGVLISLQNYNRILKTSLEMDELSSRILKEGQVISNPSRKRRNPLTRIFHRPSP